MNKVPIFLTSWNRYDFTERVLKEINERTQHPFDLHVYDNGSSDTAPKNLYEKYLNKEITSLVLDTRNTACLYNKIVFHSMVEQETPYYVVTDNDIIPPRLNPCWLTQMISIMDRNPSIAILTPRLPPEFLMEPLSEGEEVIYCKAVGNTFKLVRRSAVHKLIGELSQKLGSYGDDGILSALIRASGLRVAFCKNLWCYNLERSVADYGYTKEQLAQDPRKEGYDSDSSGHNYLVKDWDTLEPESARS
jgi:hypothetical protein